jgi:hypothetical protein
MSFREPFEAGLLSGVFTVTFNQKRKKPTLSEVISYFFHGLILLIISYPISFIEFSQVFGPSSNPFYGQVPFALGLSCLLLFLMGIVNIVVAGIIWGLRLRSGAEVWLAQGFLVAMPTQFLLLPFNPIIDWLFVNASTIAAVYFMTLLLGYIMVFGLIGKRAADEAIEKPSAKPKPPSFHGTRARCPHCGKSIRYMTHDISKDHTAVCPNCRQSFSLEPVEELLSKIGRE